MADQLKPCPCCASNNLMTWIARVPSPVLCLDCGIESPSQEVWQRRTPGPATKAMLDWCEAYIEHTELDLMLEFLAEWNR